MKNRIPHIILLAALALAATPLACGQEVVTGLAGNPEVYQQYLQQENLKSSKGADSLSLPFFEDFSRRTIYPSPSRWWDDYAFVNFEYPLEPPSIGVATLDALDEQGVLYESASQFVFEADHLTSLPFRMAYEPSDSLYLSFHYQGGGLGDPPEEGDELVLECYNPVQEQWQEVWSAEGSADTLFRQAMISLTNPEFLHNGFRFRFVNHASLSANNSDPAMLTNSDLWHIDYIRLEEGRTFTDTLPADVSFTYPMQSTLVEYEAMPWNQFRETFLFQMKPFLNIVYRNNDIITRNVTREFSIYSEYDKTQVHSFSAGAVNMEAGEQASYDAGLIYTYNREDADSALFRIRAHLITDDFDPKQNDTLWYDQHFGRYFAYDDGSAESGYGINGQGSRNAMVAYRFESYLPDSLTAVQIRFNSSYLNANQQYFDLMVWSEEDGQPGTVLYFQEDLLAECTTPLNSFVTYTLDTACLIDGPFYIGWRQKSETFLNVGLDLNRINNDKLWYYLNGSWFRSQVSGSLMLRPLTGKSGNTTLVHRREWQELLLYPNPVHKTLRLQATGHRFASGSAIRILSLNGTTVRVMPWQQEISVGSLQPGIYFLQVEHQGKVLAREKFIRIQ